MPKVGSGAILESTSTHLPPDESLFDLEDVILGSIDVIPLKGSIMFNVPANGIIKESFEVLKRLNRKNLKF